MNQIPNWFRWLIIIVATLIMCACRSPLHKGKPLSPPKMSGEEFESRGVDGLPRRLETETPDISTRLPNEPSASLAQRSNLLPPEPAPRISQPDLAPGLAPVVTHAQGGIQIEKIESVLTTEAPIQPRTKSPAMTAIAQSLTRVAAQAAPATNAVFMQVRDDAVEIELANAQLDAPTGGTPETPFLDDVVVPADTPASPVIEHGFTQQQQQIDTIVGEPILADDAALPVEHQPIACSPAPYEEYLPCGDIPVDVGPENWACSPSELPRAASIDISRLYPDEYICDGGDAAGSVRVMSDWSLRNLEPEDTVGHYDTLDHRVVVEPSNRVCIYAPRFAAARKVSGPYQNEKHIQVLLAERESKAVIEQVEQLSDQYSQTLAPQRHLMLQPASGLRVRQPGVEVVRRQAVNILDYDLSVHENLRVMKYGVHKQSEKARLAEFAAKAVTWSHDKAVQVIVDEEVVQTKVSRQGPDTIFFIGHGPAKLRVIKTASTADALPGEEVEFTLRFDNIGYQEIGNVTIVDNLTTRLEFIEDSDLCSEECDFMVDENAVESLTLRWEIKDPIAPGKGGLIRFRCRVR